MRILNQQQILQSQQLRQAENSLVYEETKEPSKIDVENTKIQNQDQDNQNDVQKIIDSNFEPSIFQVAISPAGPVSENIPRIKSLEPNISAAETKVKAKNLYNFVKNNFSKLSSNDQFISKDDLNNSLRSPSFSLQEKNQINRLLENLPVLEEFSNDEIGDENNGITLNDIREFTVASQTEPNSVHIQKFFGPMERTSRHLALIHSASQVNPTPSVEEWGNFVNPGKYLLDVAIGNTDNIHDFKMQWINGYKDVINAAAKQYDIPPLLVAGVAYVEVGGDPEGSDAIMHSLREISPVGKSADLTSFGNLSVQVAVAAETLGYDFKNLTDIQKEMVIESLEDSKENIFIASRNLAVLKYRDFGSTPANDLSDDQIKITATRHMLGAAYSIGVVKASIGYGERFMQFKQDILNALQ